MSLGARFRELTSGFHAPCDKHGKMRAAMPSSARTREGDNRLHERDWPDLRNLVNPEYPISY
jgi:hypothetical protein